MKELPDLKETLPEYRQVGSQVLQDVIERLNKAFERFFTDPKNVGLPKFQGRYRYSSITFKQSGWKLHHERLYLTGCGAIKVKWSRAIQGDIKTVTVKRTKSGKWFVCFSCDNVPVPVYPEPIRETIGIDLGVTNFVTTHEGDTLGEVGFLRRKQRYLRRVQRHLARQKNKASKRRKKTIRRLQRAHEKIANQRRDMHHKVSAQLVKENFVVAMEGDKSKNGTFKPINPKFMLKNRNMAMTASDVGWSGFTAMLQSKAAAAGRIVLLVDKHGTSQYCSGCGTHVPKKLHVRVHNCPACGLVLKRDHNAAINILARAVPSVANLRVAAG